MNPELLFEIRERPMTGFGRQSLFLDLGFHRRSVESKQGALHLIAFDTSPLKGFVQMCTLCTFCAHGELRERKELRPFLRAQSARDVHLVHHRNDLAKRVRKSLRWHT